MAQSCSKSFCSRENIHVMAIFSFALGIFFGPMSMGLYYYLIFTIIYELIYLMMCDKYMLWQRIYLFIAGLIGWIIGRWVYRFGIIE